MIRRDQPKTDWLAPLLIPLHTARMVTASKHDG